MTTHTVGISEAKANFSLIASQVNKTGEIVTVFKNNRPLVEIHPVANNKDALCQDYVPLISMEDRRIIEPEIINSAILLPSEFDCEEDSVYDDF